MSDIKTLLTGTPISTILPQKPLVYLGHNASIGDVLELLSSNSILSAPVFAADDAGVVQKPSIGTLLGFVDVWAVLVAFLQSLPAGTPNSASAEQLEAHGLELCQRSVMTLFDNSSSSNTKAALEAAGSEPQVTCADWEITDDPNTSLLEVIRTCFLPRSPPPGSGLQSYGSGMGFMTAAANMSPRVSCSTPGGSNSAGGGGGGLSPHAAAGGAGGGNWGGLGHSRHPAASHRIVVALPDGSGGDRLAVLSQSDILRFLAAKHDSLRPLGKASLAELGLANGSLHLAAGPASGGANNNNSNSNTHAYRPPLMSPSGAAGPHSHNQQHGAGGAAAAAAAGGGGGGNSCWGGLPGTPPSHSSHMPSHIPSSPKPPLGRSSLDLPPGGAGILGGSSSVGGVLGSSPGTDAPILTMQRGGSGGLVGSYHNSSGGAVMMQMSPPASPRVSAAHMMARAGSSSLGGAAAAAAAGGLGHRAHHAGRRQLVAVHESVTVLEALRVLLQQRVSAVAVLAGSGPSPNMRLVGNLSASDLRHLRRGGFGGLALTVKAFLAGKPLAPDQAIRVSPPPSSSSNGGDAASSQKAPAFIMAHAPTCFTSQATASLEELIKMLGGRCAGIHRVYVVDPDQRPAGVVTTTDVLQLLSYACSKE